MREVNVWPRQQLKIGWYCPFVYLLLYHATGNIDLDRISWNQVGNDSIQGVQLCKKLSAVNSYIRNQVLDGLVMVSCCNLSHWMIEWFRIEYPALPLYQLELPRHIQEVTAGWFDEQVSQMKTWLKKRNGGQPPEIRLPKDAAFESQDDFAILKRKQLPENSGWCSFSEQLKQRLPGLSTQAQLELLVRQIKCPRLCSAQEVGSAVGFSDIGANQDDPQCLLQNYWRAVGDPTGVLGGQP